MRPLARMTLVAAGAVVVILVTLAAWSPRRGDGDGDPADGAARTGAPAASVAEVSGEVVVSAAASLTDAFADLERAFEDRYPGVDVVLNLGGSSALAAQIRGGAPADVFASADATITEDLEDEGALATVPTVVATTGLVIAVPPGNPADVSSVTDLDDPTLVVGLCAPEVPCGRYARDALSGSGIDPAQVADTEEPDVRSLLTKVELGEVDAGIVYATDVARSDEGVLGIPLAGVEATYPIAVLTDAPNPGVARSFVDFVTSPEGRAILVRWGFEEPS